MSDVVRELWYGYLEMVKTGDMSRLDRVTDFTFKGIGERVAMSWLWVSWWKMRETFLRGTLKEVMGDEDDEYEVVASYDPLGDVLRGRLPGYIASRDDLILHGDVGDFRERWKALSTELLEGYYLTTFLRR